MSNLVFLKDKKVDYKDSFKYFIRFLKNNNAYTDFIKDWYAIKNKKNHIDHIEINTDDERLYLGHAFYWHSSLRKNRAFWAKLNRKWMIKECGVSLYDYNKMGYETPIKSYDDEYRQCII